MTPRIDNVEVEDHLDVARALQRRDRFANRQVFVEREDAGVHDAAGGLLPVFEEVLDLLRLAAAHELEHFVRELVRQIVNQRGGIVRGDFLKELGDLLGGSAREQQGARLRAHLTDRLHAEPWVPFDEDAEDRLPFVVEERPEDLREIGRVLLLQQIQKVGGRTDAQQSLDRVENEVNSAWCRHRLALMNRYNPANVA
jgi:hypothetical protein